MASDGKQRVFGHAKAARVATPAMIGLVGPSGSGKTRSALRIATGLQRVVGGDIWMIDTEAKRGLHHADKFDFTHLPFGAPFSPLDYLAAFQHCIKNGAKHIIVDSMSHEHEGPGGVLEMHAAEVDRRAEAEAKRYGKPRQSWADEKHNFPAWSAVKPLRRQMINYVLQQECNFIFCFRAKPKTKMVKVKKAGSDYEKTELQEQGFQALAGEEFLYEMLINFLLLPGAKGLPTYYSEYPGEAELAKIPEQFEVFGQKPAQLSEEIGEYIGRWCAGAGAKGPTLPAANQAKAATTKSTDATLKFHPKFEGHGGQQIDSASAEVRNEYEGWLVELETAAGGAQQAKIAKHLEEVRELNLRLEAEAAMVAGNAA